MFSLCESAFGAPAGTVQAVVYNASAGAVLAHLARARTGSGKTAAYAIPLVQKVLNAKAVGAPVCSFSAHSHSSFQW